ncbi:MAG TPA: hypothetical protein PLM29_00380 [Deltaproteobacteria bacterium]|nr:hypothetical protein [Deltaproteobacteria bacterium]
MEDFIGFDKKTTRLVHLHVHYKLILGEKHIKGHHIEREEYVLKTCIFTDTIPVPQPEVELLLAIIRIHMKTDLSEIALNRAKRYLHPERPSYPTAIWEELVFLVRRISPDAFRKVLQDLKLPVSEHLFMDYLEKLTRSAITPHDILIIRHHIFHMLRPFKRISTAHYFTIKALLKLRGLHLIPSPKNKKLMPHTGSTFAIVGADGSGKSTLAKDIETWLSWKLSVRTVYFGIPKSIVITFAQNVMRVLNLAEKHLPSKKVKSSLRDMVHFIDAARWIFIARRRLSLFKKSKKLASRGWVIITDRYPLPMFESMDQPMDGPRLQLQGESMPFLAALEKSTYDQIGLPERIFVLQADFSVLRKRKDDLDEQQHIRKVEAVNTLKPTECIIPINVNRPYEDVLMELKNEIWRLL